MRRNYAAAAAAAVFVCAASTYLAGGLASAQPPAKSKSPKAVVPKAGAPIGFGNADAITQEELKVYLYFLASDQLEGRNFPSRGYDTAALYVASHLAEWGLKPGGSTSGINGPLQSYFMPIDMVAKEVVAGESKLALTGPAPAGRGAFGFGGGSGGGGRGTGGTPEIRTTGFEYGKEWTLGTPGGFGGRGAAPDALDVSGNLVFAGNGYVIKKTNTDPYAGLDVHGKIIVVAGLPAELAAQQAAGRGARGGGGAAANPLGEACTDFWSPEQYAAKNGALAVITVANFQQLAAMSNPNAAGGRGGRGAGLNGPNFQVVKFHQGATVNSIHPYRNATRSP